MASQGSVGLPPKKKMFRMSTKEAIDVSVLKDYQYCPDQAMPEVAEGGARLKVAFAGACVYSAAAAKQQAARRTSITVHDTSLLPGYEISAVIDTISASANSKFRPGDRVILYPKEDIGFADGIDEYVVIKDTSNLIRVPKNISLEVASMLPSCGLTALSAVKKIQSHVDSKLSSQGSCQILIIGAGALGLWTVVLTHALIAPTCGNSKLNITVADTSTEKLMLAKDYGCYSVVHWSESAYEQIILDRTRNACQGSPDIIVDFVSSQRSISRALKVLNEKGALFVGGYHCITAPISLQSLASREQSIVGVKPGTKEDLEELMTMVAEEKVKVPHYVTFPVKNINKVFQDLTECKISGRAVLKVSPTEL